MIWRRKDERFHVDCIQPSFKSGRKSLMIWGCFIGDKLGPLAMCPTGRINSEKYCNLLQEHFLPFWKTFRKKKDILFMEDNAPIHVSRFSQDWKTKQKIKTMDWPPQSPDLNPIENVWQQLKLAVEARTPREKNIEQLMFALNEEWIKLGEKDILKKLVKSMPKRVQEVIHVKGMPIDY